MATLELPNQALLRDLVRRYYQDELSPESTESMSSYWKEATHLFQLEVDGWGNPISFKGSHFGSCRWTGLISRVIDQLCVLSHLALLPYKRELIRLNANVSKICGMMGLNPTLDVFRQVCTLEVLQRHLTDDMRQKRIHILMIGDAFGILSALFKAVFPNSTIVMIDIGKTLLFQAVHCQKAYPKSVHELADSVVDLDATDFVYCPAEDLKTLERFNFDAAVNVASMQEMTQPVLTAYFDFFRKTMQPDNLFYCCNRLSKTLPDGEVSEFYNYPWANDDRHLLDDGCPWSSYYFAPGVSENSARVLGVKVPLIHHYDGNVMHRLSKLSVED